MVNNTCVYTLGGNKIGASNPQHMGIIKREDNHFWGTQPWSPTQHKEILYNNAIEHKQWSSSFVNAKTATKYKEQKTRKEYIYISLLGSQNNDSFLGMLPRPNSYQPNHTNSTLRFACELRDGPQNKL